MNQCIACAGTGKASKGGPCVPCHGQGSLTVTDIDITIDAPPPDPYPGKTLIMTETHGLARLANGDACLFGADGACTLTQDQLVEVIGAVLKDKTWRKYLDRRLPDMWKRAALGNAREALRAALVELEDDEQSDPDPPA